MILKFSFPLLLLTSTVFAESVTDQYHYWEETTFGTTEFYPLSQEIVELSTEDTTNANEENVIFNIIKEAISSHEEFEKSETATVKNLNFKHVRHSPRDIPEIQAKLDRVGEVAEDSIKKVYASLLPKASEFEKDGSEEYFWDIQGDADYIQSEPALKDNDNHESKFMERLSNAPEYVLQPYEKQEMPSKQLPGVSDWIRSSLVDLQNRNNVPFTFNSAHPSAFRTPFSPINLLPQTRGEKPSILTHIKSSIQGSDMETDTFNIVITKNFTGHYKDPLTHKAHIEAMLLRTRDPSENSMSKVKDSVDAAVSAAVGSNEIIQNAVAQVVEAPGQAPVISVMNSTITDFADLEETIESLLGSNVIYQENEEGNSAVGYIPHQEGSVIENLLSKTVGIGKLNVNSNSKTNIVNIFIINIMDKVDTNPVFNPNEFPSILFSPAMQSMADQSPFQTNSKPLVNNIPSTEEQPSIIGKITETDNIPQPENLVPDQDGFITLYNILKDFQKSPYDPSFQIPDNISENTNKVKREPTEELSKANASRPSNSYGLNLNENTILDLLPNFIKATTIPPIVPLNDISLHESIGKKPSVLGLLPNQLFTITNPLFLRGENSSEGGIIRKTNTAANITNLAHLFAGDNFAGRQTTKFQFKPSKKIDFSSSPFPLPLTNLDNSNSNLKQKKLKVEEKLTHSVVKPFPILRAESTKRFPTTTKGVSPEGYPINLLDMLKESEKSGNLHAQLEQLKNFSKENNLTIPTETSIRQSDDKRNQIMRAVAIGAVPSGIAFATALFPYWAPLIFGKKRRRRDVHQQEWRNTYLNRGAISPLSKIITSKNMYEKLKIKNSIKSSESDRAINLPSFIVSSSTNLMNPKKKESQSDKKKTKKKEIKLQPNHQNKRQFSPSFQP